MPPTKERPPAADIVSVQPGKGSFIAPTIMEGRNNKTGSLGFLLLRRVLSAIDLVNVYVLGQGPRIYLIFSSCSLTLNFNTLSMISSESS